MLQKFVRNIICAITERLKWKRGTMAKVILTFVVVLCLLASSYSFAPSSARFLSSALLAGKEELDSQGYIVKPRDWFNGLSGDPGASLTDPRAVSPEMKGTALICIIIVIFFAVIFRMISSFMIFMIEICYEFSIEVEIMLIFIKNKIPHEQEQ
jgi:flagellar basal body-associated protein FliL